MSTQASTPAGIEDTIRGLVCQELKLELDWVTPTTNLRELPGVESIKILRIIAKLENRYDVELDDDVVFGVTTVAELADAVRTLMRAEPGGQ